MAGYVLHVGATVSCLHGGQAQPTVSLPRLKVGGQPAVGQSSTYSVAGCPLVSPAPGPCATAQWVTAATRVKSGGVPLLLQDSTAVCVPTGTGLQISQTQTRVRAS